MNTKAILAGTILTALFAGQTAIAGDNDHFIDVAAANTQSSVVAQTVSFQAPKATVVGVNR
ncbi:MAG: hypothetical protein V7749_05350 [Cocleimonas sp.]